MKTVMIGKVGFWTRSSAVLCLGLFAGLAVQGALAADCPGHPDAIGTERTIVVDPREHPRLGTMQYPETLPLRDHEVVLTFDDGPLPRNSDQVLQTLADNCVKATFFLIGEQARANPEGVRKLAAAGHTIGTHSQTHPLTFHKMPIEQAEKQINDGIASATAALSDPTAIAPFFRIPGLLRADGVEEYLAGRGIQVWSADFLADDWHRISPARVYDLAMKRLEAHGKGILLLHDIQARTAAALPKILQTMKARGYKIVHVVPATLQDPATPSDPLDWKFNPPSESVPIARWPKVPDFIFAASDTLAAPALSDFNSPDGKLLLSSEPLARARNHRGAVPLPPEQPWPHAPDITVQTAAVTLPVPADALFTVPEDAHAAFRVAPPPRIAVADDDDDRPKRASRGRGSSRHAERGRGRARIAHVAPARHGGHAAPSAARPATHATAAPKRPVRVAALKKR
jgi:peptidoglycan/xylan/chitin deacetylase (PgdA/CDA1 family)